jgi:hypothetical protein
MTMTKRIRWAVSLILLLSPCWGHGEKYSHEEHELFYLALDIRKASNLDIYSHSLSFNAESSKGFVASKLVLPHRVGDSFRVTTNAIFIYIDPVMVNFFSRNDWAFFIGHEFAHLLLADSELSGSELEMQCDILGAQYAIEAGYRLGPFVETLRKFGSSGCTTHGCPQQRAENLEAYF